MNAYRPYSIIIKPTSYVCNLNCHYCYYLCTRGIYPDEKSPRMSYDTLEETIRQYVGQPIPQITFCWQGGEPTLLGIDYYRKALELIEKHRRRGQSMLHAFQTNGTLLDDEWCAFFKQNGFLVGISLDGPGHLHDHYRKDKGGNGTHERVVRGIRLLQKHGVAYNVLVLLNDHTVDYPDEIYDYITGLGVEYLQFIPCLEKDGEGQPTPYSVPAGKYGAFLNRVFDRWAERDVGKVFIQIVEENLATVLGRRSSLCIHSEECGRALVVEYNGDLYSCDHFVFPEYRLGNILETPMEKLVESAAQDAFGKSKRDLPAECGKCAWRQVCNGGCLKHRLFTDPESGFKRNFYCADYKAFYDHSYPVLYRIAQDLLQRSRDTSAVKAGRNEPCPCGSGRKYKNCCGRNI